MVQQTAASEVDLAPCLTDAELAVFSSGTGDAHLHQRVDAHVDRCHDCRVLITVLGQSRVPGERERRITATTVGDRPPRSSTDSQLSAGDSQLSAGQMVGRYIIMNELGAGGMGTVYAAYDPELDREVAIKVLKAGRGLPRAAQAHLLTEARALAKLAHVNIVHVYDVGTSKAGDVFIAMELVDGLTLGEWLETQPRDWSQIVDMFVQAGTGLIGAHAANMVHGDFKPANVFVGSDGRARIGDFGVVRHTVDQQLGSAEVRNDVAQTLSVAGTPAYMAPEQLAGTTIDARADQFSFCVSLYEALFTARPFRGDTIRTLAKSIATEPLHIERDGRVPDWLAEVLERGLRADPIKRFATMADVVQALGGPALETSTPNRRTRSMLIAGIVTIAVAVGSIGYWVVAREDDDATAAMCKDAQDHLTGVWDDNVKAAGTAAFGAIPSSFAATSWANVRTELDGYTAKWTAMHTDACEKTHVYHRQPAAVLDLRMGCLNQRLTELATLTGLLTHVDKTTVTNALSAAYALSSLSHCSDVVELQARGTELEPADATKAAQARSLVAKTKALVAAAKYLEAKRMGTDALNRAEMLKSRALQAEAGHWLGIAQDMTGNRPLAQKTLRTALWNAEAVGHDYMVVLIWIARLHLAAKDATRSPIVESFVQRASAALARQRSKGAYAAMMEDALGGLRLKQGRYQQAHEHFARAVKRWKKLTHAKTAPWLPHALSNLALAQVELGNYEHAERNHREALRMYENRLGKDHPAVAGVLGNLGLLLVTTGRAPRAVTLYQRQQRISTAHFGANSREAASAHDNLGNAYTRMGKLQDGLRELQAALRLRETLLGKHHPEVSSTLHGIAIALRKARKLGPALAANQRAIAIIRKAFGRIGGDSAHLLFGLAETRMLRGEYDQASSALLSVLPITVKAQGQKSPRVQRVHMLLGMCFDKLKKLDESIRHYDAALTIAVASRTAGQAPARLRAMLSRALYKRGTIADKKRSRVLAKQAMAYFASVNQPRFVKALERWLETHK